MKRIEVREEKKDRYWALRIDPTFDPENLKRGFQPKVTTFSDKDYSCEDHEYHWKRAEVSWFSIGSCDPATAEAYAKSIEIATRKAREMDTEHKLQTDLVAPELVVTIEICKWCNSPRPIGVSGTENLPPGKHEVKMQLSHGMCVPCGTRISSDAEKGGVSQGDTVKGHNATEGRG